MIPRCIRLASILGLGSLALLASGAEADWLVTADGSRIEIVGTWQVDGERVTFTLPGGTLGSMPLSAVDLATSQALNEEAVADRGPNDAASPPRTAEFVLTDADVGHPTRPQAGADDEPGQAPAAAAEVDPGLRVVAWRDEVDVGSNVVVVTGNLQNPTPNPATSIGLDVVLYAADGTLLERSRARLERSFLSPGASIRFEARFRDTLSYDSVRFEIRSRGFLADPPAESPEAGSSGEDSGDDES